MNLTVFGAAGQTGRLLVRQALDEGHHVTAFVRDPSKLALDHERLRVVRGDLHDAASVDQAVGGADAVVNAAGRTRTSGADVLRAAARHVLPAMDRHGVRRLVTLLGAGVPDPKDEASVGRSIMLGVMKVVAGQMVEDAREHARMVRASNLDWTIVRPPRLVDGPRTGAYRTGYLKLGPRHSIARADVADFMLRTASDGLFVRESPMVSY